MEEGGKISVVSALDKDYVQIEMLDTGPGMQAEGAPLEGVGIGLKNTVDRLHEFYGDNYTFNLESGASGGLKIFMRLPLEKQIRS